MGLLLRDEGGGGVLLLLLLFVVLLLLLRLLLFAAEFTAVGRFGGVVAAFVFAEEDAKAMVL